MFYHVNGTIECCSCSIAPKVKSLFTTGLDKNDFRYKLFGKVEPCEYCNGKGCSACMVPGSLNFDSFEEALEHLQEHVEKGDVVPKRAFEGLKQDLKTEGKPSRYKK
jgi:hypothetical protein